MRDADLVALVYCDLGGIVRGRALPATHFDGTDETPAVGWVPSAFARPPFGPSVTPNPFGSRGDLRLMADTTTRRPLPGTNAQTAWDIALCDVCQTDGSPWDYCPRQLLRDALNRLAAETGARALVSFEQEFRLLPIERARPVLSLAALRSVEPFPRELLTALGAADLKAEAFVAESAPGQFEIPIAPAYGVAAADQAIVLREVVRATAVTTGRTATFAPVYDKDEPPNGVHVNLSLIDDDGDNLFTDPDSPTRLSPLGGRFAEGILHHASALVAVTAPSPVSYLRLRSGARSASDVCIAADREALLRIPPPDARGVRLEYRASDATANPYLSLAMIIRAGLAGLGPNSQHAPAQRVLPEDLNQALDALDNDAEACSWLPRLVVDLHIAIKRRELELASVDFDVTTTCRRYSDVY
jgi:glutamine synthetase